MQELNCLYAVDDLIHRKGRPTDEILQGVIEALPAGWQYPGVCRPRITYLRKATQPPDFVITPWVQRADLVVDAERVVRIVPGTLGEIDCDELEVPNRCAVFADMLGDAVVWFAILPQAPRATVELPPIIDLNDGLAVFDSGWRIPYAPVIERECDGEDIPTFSDFLRRFGPDSVTIVDLETRQVTAVRCGEPEAG